MNKKDWKNPTMIALNNNIQSANLMTNSVYETVKYVVNNTAVTMSGADCTTYDGAMYSASYASGFASSTSIGTFHIGYFNYGTLSVSVPCS